MNFFRKLERKFGRIAIPNLMYYIILMYAAGFVMSLFNPYFYVQYLHLMYGRSCGGRCGES